MVLWVPRTRDIGTKLSDAVGVASGMKRVPRSEDLVVAAVSGQVVGGGGGGGGNNVIVNRLRVRIAFKIEGG